MSLQFAIRNRHGYVLIIAVLTSVVSSIKVDFGTRGGPIVPAAPTTVQPPHLPYREPAPVWEDNSNDIPNPRSYTYELPPPSRPRQNTINIFDPDYKTPLYTTSNKPQISPANNNQLDFQVVPIYIPNEGYKYFVVMPVEKWNYLNTNYVLEDERNSFEQQKYDKFNGRYNAKLKKFKAYEKFVKPQQLYQQTKNQPLKQWNYKQ